MDQFCTKSWTNIGELSSLDWERDQSGGPSLLVRVILYCKFLSVWQSDKTARCDGPDSVISYFHFLAFIEGTILLHHIYRPGQPYVESWLTHYTTLQWTTRKMYFYYVEVERSSIDGTRWCEVSQLIRRSPLSTGETDVPVWGEQLHHLPPSHTITVWSPGDSQGENLSFSVWVVVV